jgi:hypothetical protein
MKLAVLVEEITPDLQKSFDNIFNRIHSQVKSDTGIEITPKWLAGVMNQYNNFSGLEGAYKNYIEREKTELAEDIKARIIARNILSNFGLFDKKNRYLPKKKNLLSNMRQYYSDEARSIKDEFDLPKQTREAASKEYDEWFNELSPEHQHFVTQLQELEADELAGFKGIITAKKHKKEFVTRIYQWANSNDAAHQILIDMHMITPEGKLSMPNIEKLRAFLSELTDARLKDVLSKSAVNTGKSIAHTAARASNKVLKDMEHDPDSKFNMMIKLYNYISPKMEKYEDKERAFQRMLDKIPVAHDPNGKPNEIGKGAYYLYKNYKGKKVDPSAAIKELNVHYRYPAGRKHRAEKAEGRGNAIRKVGDI